jgi:hypothetical protein
MNNKDNYEEISNLLEILEQWRQIVIGLHTERPSRRWRRVLDQIARLREFLEQQERHYE